MGAVSLPSGDSGHLPQEGLYNPLLSKGTPFSQWVSHWIHLCILLIQSCCQYKQWKHLSKESSSIQSALLKQMCSQNSLDCYSWLRATVWICFMPRVASPPVWMTLCCTDTQLDPRLRLCTLPWWALRCFPLQCSNLNISNDLSLFFFSGQITQAYFYKCPITQMLCTINQSLLALWLFKFPCKLQMGNSVCSYFHKPVLSFPAVLQGNSYSTGISVAAVIAHKGICGTLQPAPLLSSVINSWKAIEGACSEHC